RDAYHLAQLGYHVIAYERHPAIAALLDDAYRRAREDEEIGSVVTERLEFRFGDAREAFRQVTAESVYLDPMFPPARRPKALPKKELQLLRAVVPFTSSLGDPSTSGEGESTIGSELEDWIARARATAGDRVVLKRPHHVAPHPGARHRYRTKLVCYDVFGATSNANDESAPSREA
ncbi:MAG: class I SAM-dependent methyltransferase, partial [Planctomycetota bacterium]